MINQPVSQSSKVSPQPFNNKRVYHVNRSIQLVRIIKLNLDIANTLARDLSFADRFSSRHGLILSLSLSLFLFLLILSFSYSPSAAVDQVTRYGDGGTPLVPKRDPQGADSAVGPHTACCCPKRALDALARPG